MFRNLKQKWKVSEIQLALILITFAIGGSVTGYAAKKILNLLSLHQDWLWTIIYIFLIIFIWPIAVLAISIFFGQFRFFWRYVKRIVPGIGNREPAVRNLSVAQSTDHQSGSLSASNQSGMSKENTEYRTQNSTSNLAIFASGAGSNAQNIIDHFSPDKYRGSSIIKVALIVSNKKEAGVLTIAKKENIPFILIEKERFFNGDAYLNELKKNNIDWIILAGFLWKIPGALIKAYPKRIMNIHPALLPNYGGKGMYGRSVHEAVLASKEKESGITIHFVDEQYDHGDIILQVKCAVLDGDTPETLAHRIHSLEYANYPLVIEEITGQWVR